MHIKGTTVTAMSQLRSSDAPTTVKSVRQYSPASATEAKIG